MHRTINFIFSGFIIGVGLGTVFQLVILPVVGMRSFGDWTGLLNMGLGISFATGIVSAISFWFLNVVMQRQGK